MCPPHIAIAGLIAGLSAAPLHLPSIKVAPPEEISELNECIQQRFLDRKAFGMRRILPNQFHGVRQFEAENNHERAVIDRLQSGGYEVALYLKGRNSFQGMQGPAYITRLGNPQALLSPSALLEESKLALTAFQKGDEVYSALLGDWSIALRPLRAQNSTCVECHTSRIPNDGLKVGDPLGVVAYVYRRAGVQSMLHDGGLPKPF